MRATRKFYLKTYGCQMNVYDSERMADILTAEGYAAAERPEDADLVLLNTCHIREKAAEKVYSEIGRLRRMKDAARVGGRAMKIAIAGCVAQAEGEEILKRAQAVDLVIGPQSYHRLPQLLAGGKRVVDTEFPAESKFDHLPDPDLRTRGLLGDQLRQQAGGAQPVSAFLTVQEGCDRFCTFCVVPYTRGAEVSRPVMRVVEEADAMAARGVKDVMLLGQNVNAYHGPYSEKGGPDGATWPLAKLLARLAEIDGIERLRYTTSHPRDMSDDLIAAHRDIDKLMPYLHLPVQSGSDRVLAAMNRRHDRAFYLKLVERLRNARPDLALSSDFIVGFPGETDADFEETMRLIEEVRYASAFSFKYSPRPGTPAAEMSQVPEDVKAARLTRLQSLVNAEQQAFNAGMQGLTVDVLLEKRGKHPGQLVGKSPWLQAVQVDAPAALLGEIVPVAIERVGSHSLFGALADATLRERAIA